MITFYPGPSRIYPEVAAYFKDGLESGILSMNHRSEAFMALMSDTKRLLKEKLLIPGDYNIVFTSSATECWEIIAQSVIREKSVHYFNGAFGEKWMNYTSKLGRKVKPVAFNINDLPSSGKTEVSEVACFTQNETSNGTQVPMGLIRRTNELNENQLIAVDATSSLGGVDLKISWADLWFASVQKCFGLPSGMGLMLVSPKAADQVYRINERSHYNSLAFLLDNASRNQTAYTPNIADIYLLNRVLSRSPTIDQIHKETIAKYRMLADHIETSTHLSHLVENPEVRSMTVLALKSKNPIDRLKALALEEGLIIGNGYGPWKDDTFRIANFPAIQVEDLGILIEFLSRFDH